MKKTAQLRKLERQHVTPGTLVMIKAPEASKQSRWNGSKGTIKKFHCDWNPVPIVELESGRLLAVELKYLVYPKQASLF